MIRNLRDRGVKYTYFLRSIADYQRLGSFSEHLQEELEGRINVRDRMRAVIVLRDVSNKRDFDEVFTEGGCFIANPLPPTSDDIVDDVDGYELALSEETPGDISGGRVMDLERVKHIVNLLKPLIQENRSIQGLLMPPDHKQNEIMQGRTIVCVRLESLPQLMNNIADRRVAKQLAEYDLLIAREVSKLDGHVARSIEQGYVLMFDSQNAALLCAEQIQRGVSEKFTAEFRHAIAIDLGDVWRVARAHGTDYCGRTVSRCRELLSRTDPGQVTMTTSFFEALPYSDSRIVPNGSFSFNNRQITMYRLSIERFS